MNASSFEELRALRTQAIREEAERLRADIVSLIREEGALRNNASKLAEKKARIKALDEEQKGLKKQLPLAASAEEARVQDLAGKREALGRAQEAAAADKQKLQKIKDIGSNVSAFKYFRWTGSICRRSRS